MKEYVQKGIDQKLNMHFDSATKSKLVLIQNPDHSKNFDIDK